MSCAARATLIDPAMASELKRIGLGTLLVDLWGARADDA